MGKKELKCWKKPIRSKAGGVDTTFFEKKDGSGQIRVIGKTPKGKYFVARENFDPFEISEVRGSKSNSREEAIEKAKAYMRKYKVC